MRENNRNPIEKCRKKLPQFTTMNVIDGQAGLVIYSSLIFYSLTIDNILNIIVLLILAGVTISALSGDNGILQNAGKAKEETDVGTEKEQIVLAISAARTDNLGGLTEKGLRINLVDRQGNDATVTPDGNKMIVKFNESEREYTVNIDGEIMEEATPGVAAEGKETYDGAVIPDGFTVSEEPTEQEVDSGLVVIAPDESEFVWVPVEDINSMVMCKNKQADDQCDIQLNESGTALVCKSATHESGEICGKLYATSTGENFDENLTTQVYTPNSGLREPDLVTDNDTQTYLQSIGLTQEQFENQMQNDFEEMSLSVAKNGGFYIGRYETSMNDATAEAVSESGTSEIVASKEGVIPVSANYNSQRWYGLYDKQRSYAEDTGMSSAVKSSMIWGSQYDAMLNWALQGDDKDKVKASSTMHGPDPTGSQTTDIINNIYDLGTNLYEWTLEAYGTDARVNRGGYYFYSLSPSCRLSSNTDGNGTYSHFTSRLTMYVN